MPSGAQVDAGEDQRQLGGSSSRSTPHRGAIAGSWNEPGFESFVPDRQTITIPVEDLEAIAASIDEQEQVTGRRVLAEGGGHQPGERIKAFAEIGGRGVKEHADG